MAAHSGNAADYFSAKGIAPVSFMDRHMLSAGPRPSNKLLVEMRALGITDLVTLLSETEGAEEIGQRAVFPSRHLALAATAWG
jgi:hypothetical protein